MNIKRKLKKLAAAMAAVVAAFAPLGAWADTWTDDDDHVWTYSTNAVSATVSAVTDAEYDLEIPATLGGKPVVSFGTLFKGNTKISSIVIPNGVTAIAAQAFDGCSQLQHVTVGSGVTSIGNYAFRNCALLQKIELPEATTTLGIGAFASCVKLNTAKLPGVTSIPGANDGYNPGSSSFNGYGSFYGCDKLRTLQLSTNLTYIGRGAFYNCNELYDLVIPDSVTSIDNYAFAECDKLHNLTLGSGLVNVGYRAFLNDTQLETLVFLGTSVNWLAAEAFRNCQNLRALNLPNGLNFIGQSCFYDCDGIEDVVIPDTVTVCTNGAFACCDGLKSVKLGSGLTHIAGAADGYSPGSSSFNGHGLFYSCTALTNVSFNGTLKTIGNGAFYGCSALPAITIPGKVTSIGNYAFSACGLLKDVVIGDNVRLIKHHAFYGDSKLETLELGAKVQTIEYCAFQNCTALKSFPFPETVLTIGDWCFNGCCMLSNLVLPDSVGVIGVGSFSGCTGLTSIKIGDGLEEISGSADGYSPGSSSFNGHGAFSGCTGLTKVEIGPSVFTIGNGAFYGCTALPSITIPSNVSSIKNYAFAANTALTTIDIKDGGVTSIGDYAFNGDSALTTAHLGDRLVTIGTRAFQNCSKLTGLVLPDSLVTIGGWCFENCKDLKSIDIPDKVKDLNSGAFAYCSGLTFAKIGRSLATIGGASDGYSPGSSSFKGYGAFYCCTALRSVDLGTTLATISSGAFYGCSSLASIDIPDSVTKIGDYAFGECASLAKADLGAGIVTVGRYAFNNDTALHYVTFAGDEAPVNVGASIFNGTKDRMTVYVETGSEGWRALHEGGLPDNGMWQGRRIAYAPPPEGAGNPYDFYPYVRTDTISRVNYPWSMIVTADRYVTGKTKPEISDVIYDDETVYLSYCFDEYWRGEPFNVTNVFTLAGTKTGTFSLSCNDAAHATWTHWWTTNAVPEALQNLPVGDYTLSVVLNGDRCLAETDYANNTTSITFRVESAPLWTVSFNPNDGTVDEESRQVKRNTAIGELPEPVRVGYTFTGWFTSKSGGTQMTAESKVTVESVTVYAHWTAKTRYSVTFNANGGSPNETRTLYGGDPFGELPKPTKAGHFLLGWFTAVSEGEQITEDSLVSGAATYYAYWQQGDGRFKVTFGKNGGTGGDNFVTATYGSAMPSPRTAPKKAGYTFDGYWDTTKEGGRQYYDGSMNSVRSWDKASTATLWAKWVPVRYKVTFGKNGGTGGDDYVTATYAAAMPSPRTAPKKSGYIFEGYWNTTGENGVCYYDANMKSAHVWDKTSAATLWAKWRKAAVVKVTFGKNGGSGGDDYVTATEGSPMPTPRTAPTRTGWTFGGYWDTLSCDAKGNPLGKQYYDASMKSVRNWDKSSVATLWAKWTVRVKLGKNGGTGGDDYATVTYNQPFPTRKMPTKSGYTFGGYFISASSKTGQCYNADGTGTSSMKWSTGGTPTIWALWTKTSSCVELSPAVARRAAAVAPSASAAPAPAEPAIPAGIYSGVLADGTGAFWLVLDEAEKNAPRTAFLYVSSEDGSLTAECTAEEVDGILLLMTDGGGKYVVDIAAGIAICP